MVVCEGMSNAKINKGDVQLRGASLKQRCRLRHAAKNMSTSRVQQCVYIKRDMMHM